MPARHLSMGEDHTLTIMASNCEFVLALVCPDVKGIVQAVSTFLLHNDCNILESTQSRDAHSGSFTMRVQFSAPPASISVESLRAGIQELTQRFQMQAQLFDLAVRPRALIMVSKQDHCLNDLLYRHRKGTLPIDIPIVVSNHRDAEILTASYNIPFRYLPLTPEHKAESEAALLSLIAHERIDFVVLARYMQVLSSDVCTALAGRVINIHHSFLPGFKGARPYHQACERGVKLIGATAHYVTADLDEGPIIEQDVIRVDHRLGPDALAETGRDIEQQVLARAVRYQAEHRILLVGNRTVVFS
jgi:formyltetrahydrofolate deformylase